MSQASTPTPDRSWQMGKSLLDCHQHMFTNQVSCDVKIQFSSSGAVQGEIGAHKYVLMCRSPVFEAMLTGAFVKDVGSSVTIDIPDVEPGIFKEVLKYMYYDGATIVALNVLPVLQNAKKYLLDGLVKLCMSYLEYNMSVANACTLLNTCAFEEVIELCLQYMRSHPAAVLGSANFYSLTQDGLYRLLTSDLAYDQRELFDVSLKWANHQLEQDQTKTHREVLGRCLYHLGFTSMSSSELAAMMKDTPILSDTEQLALFRYAALPDEEISATLKGFGFSQIPVTLTTRSWFDRIDIEKSAFGNLHGDDIRSSLTFSVDKAIVFRGLGIFGTEKGTRYSLALDLYGSGKINGLTTNGDSLCRFDTRVWSRGIKDPIRIVIPTPIELTAAVEYRIQITLSNIKRSNIHMYRGHGQAEKVNCGRCTFTLDTGGNHNNGLIAQILYS